MSQVTKLLQASHSSFRKIRVRTELSGKVSGIIQEIASTVPSTKTAEAFTGVGETERVRGKKKEGWGREKGRMREGVGRERERGERKETRREKRRVEGREGRRKEKEGGREKERKKEAREEEEGSKEREESLLREPGKKCRQPSKLAKRAHAVAYYWTEYVGVATPQRPWSTGSPRVGHDRSD